MTRRPGLTLLEVLMAIFVMAIGMIAVLTLFPIGAFSMAQAIRNDRCATCAVVASSQANGFNLRGDSALTLPAATALLGLTPSGVAPILNPLQASYPVYVDALGNGGTPFAQYGTSPGITRVTTLSYATGTSATRWFTLLDDMSFDENGAPLTVPGTAIIDRGGRYTWAYLLKRPVVSDPTKVGLWVVVYYNRPLSTASREALYSAAGAAPPGAQNVTLSWAAGGTDKPTVRRNAWILDVTYNTPTATTTYSPINGDFYRVVNAVESGQTTICELESPIRGPDPATGLLRQFVVMEDVVEVFYRGLEP